MNTPVAAPTSTRAIRGIAWTLPTTLLSRAVGLVGTLLLARYLTPGEYGEVSAAVIVTLTASSVTTFGVGVYLVATRDLSRSDAFHASCWFLATGMAAMVLVWVFGEPLGAWADVPNIGRFLPVLLLGMLLDRVSFLPERMLVRDLRFRWLSLARAVSELAFTGVALVLAVRGAGAFAIAWANLARSAIRFVAIVPAADWRDWIEPHRLRLAKMLEILSYGVTVALTSVAVFAMRRWDNLLVSRFFGPAAMGSYNYAYNLADMPAGTVGEQMGDVIFASLPHVREERRVAALVRSLTMMSVIMLPLAFGLGAVAGTVVQTFFDERWTSVGPMLALLSVLAAARPIEGVFSSYLYACESPRTVMWLNWAGLAALMLAISTIGRVSLAWTCGSVAAVFVLRALAAMWAVSRRDRVALSSFLTPLAGPLVACITMAAAIMFVRDAMPGAPPALRLAVEVATGVVVYLAGAMLFFRATAREFLGVVRTAVSRR